MTGTALAKEVDSRIAELLALYSAGDACAAHLLCDQHDPEAPAHRIVAADLSFRDITYGELRRESERFAGVLKGFGIGPGDRVATLMGKTREYLVAVMGIWRLGAVHVPLFTAFAPPAIALRMQGSGAKAVVCDPSQRPKLAPGEAIPADPPWRVVTTGEADEAAASFAALMAAASPVVQAAAMGGDAPLLHIYTSGTTGNPKGVVYHHRGAYLNAIGNALEWALPHHPTYLWTLPLFHCNGWCFPWTIAAVAGTNVCMRGVGAADILHAIQEEGVTHMCGAPIVLNMVTTEAERRGEKLARTVRLMTAGAAPPAAVLERSGRVGFHVTHAYGLTECYGPNSVCAWHPEWDELPAAEQATLKARQGVPYVVQEELTVLDPETMEPVPADGVTIGEVMMRGNVLMKGYLKNPSATEAAFEGGYFHTGDLGVMHPDGYIEIRDRSKDIIISGGENISSIEVEGVLYRHPAVSAAAVVAKPDEHWGETPCAFIELREGEEASESEIVEFCRENLAHFKAPQHVVFGELPKTSTGKIQKFVLRERVGELL